MFGKLFGLENPVRAAEKIVAQINEREKEFEKLGREELVAKTRQWQEKFRNVEVTSEILPEAFAAVREAAKRTLGQRHYDVQLVGGLMLHEGRIAEMKTGEGKTLAATTAVYLNALSGRGVHVVTVNDYLARRDASWMGQIYDYLGLSVAAIGHEVSYLYSGDVIARTPTQGRGTKQSRHATGQVSGDGIATPSARDDSDTTTVQLDVMNLVPCARSQAYAADILYGTNNEFGFDYLRDNMAGSLAQMVQRGLHYAIVDEVDSILIDEARTPLIISAPDAESTDLYREFASFVKVLEPADYVLEEKHRQINFSEKGYEKLERKYGQEIYSDIKLRHHADTALRAEALFKKDRDYVNRAGEIVIVDEFTGRLMPGRRYSEGLHQAIEAKEGVPVKQESKTLATITFQNYFRLYKKLAGMTGTASTESEEFHKIYALDVVEIPTHRPMIRADLSDSVYKTEKGKFEAIIREVRRRHETGQPILIGTISIERNEYLSSLLKQAGIRHEILNAKNHEREAHIIAKAGQPEAVTLATNIAGRGVDIILGAGMKELGGLHILGTERHESRRIDNQLRGRSGRQGDPGSSQFFLSLEDDLMRLFGGERVKRLMDSLGVPEDQPIEHGLVSKTIESAQKKIEGFNFDTRKHVLEFDDVLNKQREAIYGRRRKILSKEMDLKAWILERIEAEITQIENADQTAEEKQKMIRAALGITDLTADVHRLYEEKEKKLSPEVMRQIERLITLQAIDSLWMEHLDTMDHLRKSVRLRGYAQKDPLVEYRQDGLRLFRQMLREIDKTIVYTIFKVEVKPREQSAAPAEAPRSGAKVGRNDPCPCGSGKKYKKCHGK